MFLATIFLRKRETERKRENTRAGKGLEGEGEGERERERETERDTERERGREKENTKQAPCSVQSLMQSSIPRPWDHDLRQNQELSTQLTELYRRLSVSCNINSNTRSSTFDAGARIEDHCLQ